MMTVALIGLVGGLITGVSPCVLPMLPIIFFAGGAAKPGGPGAAADAPAGAGGGTTTALQTHKKAKRRDWRPLIVISGLVVSFSIFTLVGSSLLSLLGLPQDFLRWAGLVVLGLVGLGMLIPPLGHLIERPFYRLPKVTGGRGGPFVLGLGLGTLYVPCAGPILAAITVAGASGTIGVQTIVLTVAFAIGAATPLLIFAMAGSGIRRRIDAYRTRAAAFRIAGGVAMLVLAVALAFNITDVIQRAIPDYTASAQKKLADSESVQGALDPFPTDENRELSKCTPGANELASCGVAPALRGTGQWFNTPGDQAVSLADLRGKVVLLDFFAYSCINCQRDQPYLQQWNAAYSEAGLQVLGVHSPEFAFEKVARNLEKTLKREGTTYPVVQDNDLATWRAYRNRYWPAKYLIDGTGTVRAINFGEGNYEQTEGLIRDLLRQNNPAVVLPDPVTKDPDRIGTEGQTAELYLAPNRNGYAGTPTYLNKSIQEYELAADQPAGTFSLGGKWQVDSTSVTALESKQPSQIQLHYRATNVYNVLSGEGTVTVSRTGKPDKVIEVTGTPNLYPIVEGDEASEAEITLTYSPGVSAFTFSFG